MRKSLITKLAALTVGAAMFSGTGMAFSQTPPPATAAAPAPAPDALSAEDRNASPFPPGRHAAVVKKVCTGCHGPDLLLDMRYTKDEAERFYKNMVSSDLSTEQAKQIVEYLTTTLGL